MIQRAGIRDERGISLVEILVAIFVISVGLVGLAVVVPVASSGVQEGNQLSTATFLAEQRMEQLKNALWTASPDNDCLGVGTTAAPTVPIGKTCTPAGGAAQAAGTVTFPDETSVSGFAGYGRTVRVSQCTVTACGTDAYAITDALDTIRLLTVTVTYNPLSGAGSTSSTTTKSTMLTLMIAKR